MSFSRERKDRDEIIASVATEGVQAVVKHDDVLFANGDLRDWLRARLAEAMEAARSIAADRALAVPELDLVQELVDRYRVDAPRLRLEEAYSPGARDVRVDVSRDVARAILDPNRPYYVPGTRIEIHIPFDGHPDVFHLRPSSFSTVFPRGRVEDQTLIIGGEAPADAISPERLKADLDGERQRIQQYLDWISADCAQFNQELARAAEGAVRQRKEKVLQDRKLEAFLRIPIQRRPDASHVFTIPLQRRRRPVTVPPTPPAVTEPFAPEPAISLTDFTEILEVIKGWRDLVERLPGTFGPMREEALRDTLLVVLNNQFGPVGGEVFSRKGKTDVFIWHEKGAVFVAECKFWKGPKAFAEAVNQLLGYLVWRDSKSALILFVREKGVSEVAARANDVIQTHPRFKRRAPDTASLPAYILHHEGDPNREIQMALLVASLPRDRDGEPGENGE